MMKVLQPVLLACLFCLVAFLAFRSDFVSAYALQKLGSGWMMAYLIPRLIVILSSLFAAGLLWRMLNLGFKGKLAVSILTVALCVGAYLGLNLPYINDWFQRGDDLSGQFDGNPIQVFLNEKEEFNGLVCLALPDCPHCIRAVPKLEQMQKRCPDQEFVVLVFAKDSTGVDRFLEHFSKISLPVHLVPDRPNSGRLTTGSFPTFLYFKDGKLVHRWTNMQFGYPAMDWIESKLE